MNIDILTEKVQASRAGRELSADIVREAVRWALERYPAKEAEKAAKARLHQLYGSYVEDGHIKEAACILDRLEQGQLQGRDAALKLMALHSSTRERLKDLEQSYQQIFECCGRPRGVLDIACGFNPLSFYLLGMAEIPLAAIDAGQDLAILLNRFFSATGMANARATAGDALASLPKGKVDLALVMKFLPLCERVEKGGALKLLNAIEARHIVVSFPTKTLSGRSIGMEGNYGLWFESLGYAGKIISRFSSGNELFYVLESEDK